MDSMAVSVNNPTDGCFWVEGLMLGNYEVTIYAMTPNDPSRMSRTRVDNGSPGPVMVGGQWPGHHQSGVTYSRFTVTTTDGVIAFHDGLYGGVIQSGMNGVQLRFLGTCPSPTISQRSRGSRRGRWSGRSRRGTRARLALAIGCAVVCYGIHSNIVRTLT